MEIWLEGVQRILTRAPTGALAFSRIIEELATEGIGRLPEPRWLLRTVADRNDLFRVIPLARGPWAHWPTGLTPRRKRGQESALDEDPWILLLRPPEAGFGSQSLMKGRLTEGLLAWGQYVDDASPTSVARWIRATRESSRAWRALVSGNPAPSKRPRTTTPPPGPPPPGGGPGRRPPRIPPPSPHGGFR